MSKKTSKKSKTLKKKGSAKAKPHGIKIVDGDEPTKAAKTPKAAKPAGVITGEVGKNSKLTLVTRRGRVSRFVDVLEKMKNLKEGDHVLVPCELGKDGLPNTKGTNNMLWVMRRRSGVMPPKGCVFQSRTTADGNLAILCVAAKDKNKV